MSKKPTFLNKKAAVTSLVMALSSAGAIDALAGNSQMNKSQSESSRITLKSNTALVDKNLVLVPAGFDGETTRTAGHSSHASHASHGSHASHASHSSSAY